MATSSPFLPGGSMVPATGTSDFSAQSVGADPNVPNMNPSVGFSSRYNPSQLANVIWDSPWAILPDVFKGINQTGPGYQALRDIGADPLTLYNIMVGGTSDFMNPNAAGNAPGNYANWLNSLYTNYGSRGGEGFSAGNLISQLLHPTNNADTKSSLYNILTAGDASTQMRTLFNMLRDATNVGMNPLAARGYQAAASNAGDSILNQIINSQNDASGAANVPVYQQFIKNNPGLVPGR